jgi:hypothetical protein
MYAPAALAEEISVALIGSDIAQGIANLRNFSAKC